MKIKRIICGGLQANFYIIYEKEGGSAWVVDPGYEPKKYLNTINELKLTVQGILLTHYHYDHAKGAAKLQEQLSCPILIHAEDAPFLKYEADVDLYGGEVLKLDNSELTLEVLHTPGHTKGSVCFYSDKHKKAITGDTIFNVDLGRTDLPGGSDEEMRESLVNVINKWANDVMIYPGHGDPATMKFVRDVNEEFLDMLK